MQLVEIEIVMLVGIVFLIMKNDINCLDGLLGFEKKKKLNNIFLKNFIIKCF